MENKESLVKGLEILFNSLLDNKCKEEKELYSNVKQLIKVDINSPRKFYFSFLNKLNNFINGLIKSKISNYSSDIIFLLINYDFIVSNLEHFIRMVEGSCCISDKTNFITYSLFNYFKDNKEIEFNFNSDYSYQLPEKVFTTQEEILFFFNAIKELYYGKPNKYLTFVTNFYVQKDIINE